MVILSVANEKEIDDWLFRFQRRNAPVAFFQEPDIGNQKTAIAVLPENGNLLKSLPMI
jgi:hypothetical protein